jgi:outer membrane protein assembly factor BamB
VKPVARLPFRCLFMAVTATVVPGVAAVPSGASTEAAVFVPAPDSGIDESVAFHVGSAHDGRVVGGHERPPLARRWTRALGSSVSYPLVTNGRVFATATTTGALSTSLFALDATTGLDLWGPLDIGGSSVGLTAGAGLVFTLNGSGFLQAFDQVSGHPVWIADVVGQYSFTSAPTYRNGMVFTGAAGSGGTVYGFSALTGELVWTSSVANGDNSSPAVTDSGVYVSYACQQDYAFVPATGVLRWHHSTGCSGGGGTTAAVAGGRFWSPGSGLGGSVVLDDATGEVTGTFPGGPLPAFDGQKGFFLDGRILKAKDLTTMAPLWSAAGDEQFVTAPIVVNGYVYEGSSTGMLFAFDETTGEVAWSANVGEALSASTFWGQGPGLAAGAGLIVVPTASSLVAFGSAASGFTALDPVRLLDTRTDLVPAGWSARTPVGAGQPLDLPVAGVSGVPANATAVVLNVTATDATSGTYLSAEPTGSAPRSTSVLNVGAGDVRANAVTLGIGANRSVTLHNAVGATHVLVDLLGFYRELAPDRFAPLTPTRLLDTRPGANALGTGPALGPGEAREVTARGVAGVPVDATAVVLNVTAVAPTRPTFLAAYRAGATRPPTSNVNARAGATVPNLVVVGLDAGGRFNLWNDAGTTDVVVDVLGAYGPSATQLFTVVNPVRLLDTRTTQHPLGPGENRPVTVTGVPVQSGAAATTVPVGAGAAAVNVTATDGSEGTYLVAGASDAPVLGTSTLNVGPAEVRANLAVTGLGPDGGMGITNRNGTVEVVLDLEGYFASPG